jgi:hypothetical protein
LQGYWPKSIWCSCILFFWDKDHICSIEAI